MGVGWWAMGCGRGRQHGHQPPTPPQAAAFMLGAVTLATAPYIGFAVIPRGGGAELPHIGAAAATKSSAP